jgi:hypothetical protein
LVPHLRRAACRLAGAILDGRVERELGEGLCAVGADDIVASRGRGHDCGEGKEGARARARRARARLLGELANRAGVRHGRRGGDGGKGGARATEEREMGNVGLRI